MAAAYVNGLQSEGVSAGISYLHEDCVHLLTISALDSD